MAVKGLGRHRLTSSHGDGIVLGIVVVAETLEVVVRYVLPLMILSPLLTRGLKMGKLQGEVVSPLAMVLLLAF
ncbi:hypothetical protein Tco_1566489, partial [Tanacetum coccineum]